MIHVEHTLHTSTIDFIKIVFMKLILGMLKSTFGFEAYQINTYVERIVEIYLAKKNKMIVLKIIIIQKIDK